MFKRVASLLTALLCVGAISALHAEGPNDPAPYINARGVVNGKKILFDNTHAETSGQADWVIDGAFSDFGNALADAGFYVKELRKSTPIELADLTGYDALVIAEANIPFKTTEQAALLQYVQNGGAIFFVADHYNADRNKNRWDGSEVFNGYRRGAWTNPAKGMTTGEAGSSAMQGVASSDWLATNFGIRFRYNALGDIVANDIVAPSQAFNITAGVATVAMHAGSTLAIMDPTKAKGIVYLPPTTIKWASAVDQGVYDGGGRPEGPFAAVAKIGLGKAAFLGDSSPVEDATPKYLREETGGSKTTHSGWQEQNDATLMVNIVTWLANHESYTSLSQVSGLQLDSPTALLAMEDPASSTEPQAEPWAAPAAGYYWYDPTSFKAGSYGAGTPAANTVTASITTPSGNVTLASGTSQSFAGTATDSSSSATLTYAWTFGDGGTATGATATHTYTNTGSTAVTYTATLTATDNTGAKGTATRSITVNPASTTLAASVTTPAGNVTIASGTAQSFAGSASGGTSPYTYSWTFGDGGTATAASTSHTYTNTGSANVSYTATFKVTDSLGATASATRTITVTPATTGGTFTEVESNNSISTANAVASTYTGIKGYLTSSTDVDYFALSLAPGQKIAIAMSGPSGPDWDLYLKNSAGSTLASSLGGTTTESLSYTNSGTTALTVFPEVVVYSGTSSTPYNLALTYSGGTTSNTVSASITTPSSNVTLASGTAQSFAGSATDSSSSATLTYGWAFGDGGTATGATASHTFTNTGTSNVTYTVTFTATDNTGAKGTATRTITVTPATANTVSASITTPSSNVTLASGTAQSFAGSATDSSSSATLTYGWTFGDGGTATGATASHTFTNTGTANVTYTVTFTATDNTGVSGTATRTITVTPATTGGSSLAENFDTGTKTAYSVGNVTFASGTWTLNDALLGNTTSDPHNGVQSVRTRNSGTVTMLFDFPTGAKTVSVKAGSYGTDGATTWGLWYSTNAGSTWTQAGSSVTTSSSTLTTSTFTVNVSGAIRFQIRKTDGSSYRVNFDDFAIAGY
ncbi:MAG TPA: PKD domain-containing protein [Holophagaceae bacterium]|nr:PKD domain-containing protein [Holophagaceae bacterium]